MPQDAAFPSQGRLRCERAGALARITLSHPGRLNAMSRAMWRALRATITELAADPGLRCIIMQGEGGHFCAGGDISEYPDFRFDEASLRDFHEHDVWGALQALLDCDVPTLAAIEGHCMGAGIEIAACCDLRLAADTARFGAPIGRLGFPMAPREVALLLREAGALTTRELLLQGAVLDAATLQARGFLHAVSPAAHLQAEVQTRVQAICALAPEAARLNKQTLRVLNGCSTEPPDALLRQAYAYAGSAEHREGVAAFLAKRRPEFSITFP
jgi:enoyl-CoA hydratase/carnithine racemase